MLVELDFNRNVTDEKPITLTSREKNIIKKLLKPRRYSYMGDENVKPNDVLRALK